MGPARGDRGRAPRGRDDPAQTPRGQLQPPRRVTRSISWSPGFLIPGLSCALHSASWTGSSISSRRKALPCAGRRDGLLRPLHDAALAVERLLRGLPRDGFSSSAMRSSRRRWPGGPLPRGGRLPPAAQGVHGERGKVDHRAAPGAGRCALQPRLPPPRGRRADPFVVNEYEPVFDAADFVRCGRDLFGIAAT